MAYRSSAAALAFFAVLLCGLPSWCVASEGTAAADLFVPAVSSTNNNAQAAAMVSTGVPAKTNQQEAAHPVIFRSSKRGVALKNKTAGLRRNKTALNVTLSLLVAAVVAVVLTTIKLNQCRQQLKENKNTTEGTTRRRLAEGGADSNGDRSGEEECVSGFGVNMLLVVSLTLSLPARTTTVHQQLSRAVR
uniref:Toxoplasma gondii family B protein n=1 Tax=Toxoplasma gondii (strain ATCC 50861 / VEG) TaxID=432359 RepID=A0A0F7UPH1_TOXGV|nr:TPA: hypothetical protein BN1205_059350 [Toxoplasma gondii VEG]